jgi:hypothetical protein
MGALAMYVLACSPAFSPDGNRLLVPILGPQGKASIALYDLRTGKSETVFALTQAGGEITALGAQWLPDGKQAVALEAGEKELLMALFAPGQAGATRLMRFPTLSGEDIVNNVLLSAPIISNQVYLAGDKLNRIDLKSGGLETRETPDDTSNLILYQRDNRLLYLAEKEVSDSKDENKDEKTVREAGWVDLSTLELKPVYRLETDDSFGEICFPSRDGTRLAWLQEKEDKENVKQFSVVIFRNGKVEKRIPLDKQFQVEEKSGLMTWAADEQALFVTFIAEGEDDQKQFGILEIPLVGEGAIRKITLASRKAEKESLVFIALSPNGKLLAATIQGPEARTDSTLYLVDLAKAERPVKKVALPNPFPEEAGQ